MTARSIHAGSPPEASLALGSTRGVRLRGPCPAPSPAPLRRPPRPPFSDRAVAALALTGLTAINCLGVRAGSSVQNTLMVLKILAIMALVGCGFLLARGPAAVADPAAARALDSPVSLDLLTGFGAALVPILFAYGGWQTAAFVAEEIREPRRNLPRGLIAGVVGVIALYL